MPVHLFIFLFLHFASLLQIASCVGQDCAAEPASIALQHVFAVYTFQLLAQVHELASTVTALYSSTGSQGLQGQQIEQE